MDEVYRIIQQVQDADKVDDLAAKLSLAEQKLRALMDAERAQVAAGGQFSQAVTAAAAAVHKLKAEVDTAESSLGRLDTKLSGAKRASAKFQVGLAGVNIVQDVAQGGPASGINNILGLAGNNSARALGGEFVAAAGGATALVGALGTVAVAAGAAFLTIDQGLKSNKLGWDDLGSVVDQMAGGAFSDFAGQVVKDLGAVWDQVKSMVGGVADVTIGWNSAADAVRLHNEQVERGAQATRDYEAAVKSLAGVKNTTQKESGEKAKNFVGNLSELEQGGLGELAEKMAALETGRTGDNKVSIPKLDEKGKQTGEFEEITRKEQARRRLMVDFAAARGGDTGAADRVRAQALAAGYDAGEIDKDDKKFALEDDQAIKDEEDARKLKKDIAKIRKQQAELEKKALEAEAKINADAWQAELAGAKKSKSYLDKPDDQLSNAERAAKKDADELAEAKRRQKDHFDKGVDEARRGQTYEGVDEQDLTPEQKRAKTLDEKAKSEEEKVKRESVEKADKATAGTAFDDRTKTAALASMLKGGGQGAAKARLADQIRKELEARGLTPEEARVAANEKADKTYGDTRDEIIGEARKPIESKSPQHLGAEEFTRSVQSAAADSMKQLLDVNKLMKDYLAMIARNTGMGQGLAP